jgi:hypothetical protein
MVGSVMSANSAERVGRDVLPASLKVADARRGDVSLSMPRANAGRPSGLEASDMTKWEICAIKPGHDGRSHRGVMKPLGVLA